MDSKTTCSVDGCERATRSGKCKYCSVHYNRHRAGVDMEKPIRARTGGRPCSVPGCERGAMSGVSGEWLCAMHEARRKRGYPLELPIQVHATVPDAECIVDGCTMAAYHSSGVCKFHYGRRRYNKCGIEGPEWRGWCRSWWRSVGDYKKTRLAGWSAYCEELQKKTDEANQEKRCSVCCEVRPIDEYPYKTIRKKTATKTYVNVSRYAACKSCRNKARLRHKKAWRKRNPEAAKARDRAKSKRQWQRRKSSRSPNKCRKCLHEIERGRSLCELCRWLRNIKPVVIGSTRKEFKSLSGFLRPCKECSNTVVEMERAGFCSIKCADKNRRREHKRRNRLAPTGIPNGVHVSAEIRKLTILMRDEYVCYMCDRVTSPSLHYLEDLYPTVDHVIPTSRGGDNSFENLRCACRKCNGWKQRRLFPSETGPSPFRDGYVPEDRPKAKKGKSGYIKRGRKRKLANDQVAEIIARYASGNARELASEFKIDKSYVYMIVRNARTPRAIQ